MAPSRINELLQTGYYNTRKERELINKGLTGFAKFIFTLIVIGAMVGLCAAGGTLGVVIGGSILHSAGWLGVMSVPQMAMIGAMGGAVFSPLIILLATLGYMGHSQKARKEKKVGGVERLAFVIALPVYASIFSLVIALAGADMIGMKGLAIGFSAAAGAIGAVVAPVVAGLGTLALIGVLAAMGAAIASCFGKKAANLDFSLSNIQTHHKPVNSSTINGIPTSPLLLLSSPSNLVNRVSDSSAPRPDTKTVENNIAKNQPTFI